VGRQTTQEEATAVRPPQRTDVLTLSTLASVMSRDQIVGILLRRLFPRSAQPGVNYDGLARRGKPNRAMSLLLVVSNGSWRQRSERLQRNVRGNANTTCRLVASPDALAEGPPNVGQRPLGRRTSLSLRHANIQGSTCMEACHCLSLIPRSMSGESETLRADG
jgi:hypothetical protein